jgi:CRP-like cAMP-binding protein
VLDTFALDAAGTTRAADVAAAISDVDVDQAGTILAGLRADGMISVRRARTLRAPEGG